MGRALRNRLAEFGRLLRKAGPYVVLEVVLLGSRRPPRPPHLPRTALLRAHIDEWAPAAAVERAGSDTFDQLAFVWRPAGPG